ncbi:MAG TPA: aliphatic sulfonate ABC transporter substrate-binding protein [Verrucomicrobiales bacterium]|nr:aliphatic sulfonate ABC transporter substrate-binding protein [Verrucomicrobiales bacterium]
MNRRRFLLSAAALTGCRPAADPEGVLRIGHFPNVTHVQALVARSMSREGRGWFEQCLGLEVRWFMYNAGPSVAEAVFARSLDAAYMGPSPLLNAYVRSDGREMRVLSGAVNGGAALLTHPQSGIEKAADFRGKKLATPQLGNTQDVQARAWLRAQGFQVSLTRHDVYVIPTKNADQLALFAKGDLDAIWTTEPWATRLEVESDARVFLEDTTTPATLLAARADFAGQKPDLAEKLATAHRELTAWIRQNPAEAAERVRAELEALTTARLSPELLARSMRRLVLTDEVSPAQLQTLLTQARDAGFLRGAPALDALLSACATLRTDS